MLRWITCGLLLLSANAMALDLNWLGGAWCGGGKHGGVQESWSDASGDLMLGVNKDVRAGRKTAFEFLRIEIDGDKAAYISQPGGAPPTRFDLIESGEQRALFANPTHDFPKRIGYRRDGDHLEAWIDDGSDGGQRMDWRWGRCAVRP